MTVYLTVLGAVGLPLAVHQFHPFQDLVLNGYTYALVIGLLVIWGVVTGVLRLVRLLRYGYRRARIQWRGARRATGRVVRHARDDRKDRSTAGWRAVVEFPTSEGRIMTYFSDAAPQSDSLPAIGKQIELLYDPANPNDVVLM